METLTSNFGNIKKMFPWYDGGNLVLMVNYPDLPGAKAQVYRTLSHWPGGPNAVFGVNFNPETGQWDCVTYHDWLDKQPKSKCSFCKFASTYYTLAYLTEDSLHLYLRNA